LNPKRWPGADLRQLLAALTKYWPSIRVDLDVEHCIHTQ
jgi:hypothetical protein